MKKIFFCLLLLCFTGIAGRLNAQTGSYFNVQYTFTGQVQNQYDSIWTITYVVHISDINDFEKLQVIFRADGVNDTVNHFFNLHEANTGIPEGVSFSLDGNVATIVLGNYNAGYWVSIVKLEDYSENITELPLGS